MLKELAEAGDVEDDCSKSKCFGKGCMRIASIFRTIDSAPQPQSPCHADTE